MIVDIDRYRVNRDFAQKWYEKNLDKGQHDGQTLIATLSISTMVPIIVIYHWIGEITNWEPHVVESIAKLSKFYGYTEIRNKPPGAP